MAITPVTHLSAQLKMDIVRYHDDVINDIDLQTEQLIIHLLDAVSVDSQSIELLNQRRVKQIEYLRLCERNCLFDLSHNKAFSAMRKLDMYKSLYFLANRSNQLYLVQTDKVLPSDYVEIYQQVIKSTDEPKCRIPDRLNHLNKFYNDMVFNVNGCFTNLKAVIESERSKFKVDCFMVELNIEQNILLELIHVFLVNFDQVKDKLIS